MSVLDKLNEQQRKAAERIEGPTLILAGAGSGKTRTITYKIAYMVKEKNISPFSILALTFTNKAANEMKERIINLVDDDIRIMQISTFHSFGVRLLRKYGTEIGIDRKFNIYDVDDSKAVIKKILKDFQYKGNLTPATFYSKISSSKENYIDYKTFAETVDLKIGDNRFFYEVFKNYQDYLTKNFCLDFSDILVYSSKLLDNPTVLNLVQERYKYILVDEYQDTNNIQYDIVNKIANKYKNICVVGDENQSIYAFRGANIENILNFEKDYPDALIVKLEENYRSTQTILNLANSVIKNNKSSLGKNLWTSNNKGQSVSIYEAFDAFDEAKYIVNIIKTGIKDYRDYTILYRTNSQSRILEQELNRAGIRCKVFGGLSFYQRKEVKYLLSYLMFLNNPYDFVSFERSISNPKRKIGTKTIEKIREIAETKNCDFIEALQFENTNKTMEFYNLIKPLFDDVDNVSISSLLSDIVEKTEYIEYLKSNDSSEEKILNVHELISSIKEVERYYKNITLDEYLTTASLSSVSDKLNNDDYVKLMTIHTSKGLEFDTVFIVGFENGIFPSYDNINSEFELEEERRLCYVAVTRAKNTLHIIHSRSRTFNGVTYFSQMPSLFLREMDRNFINFVNKKYNNENNNIKKAENMKIENFNPFKEPIKKGKYYVGQVVNHTAYGKGKVKYIDDKSITIEFYAQTKKLSILLADKFLR